MKWTNTRIAALATLLCFTWLRWQGASLYTNITPRGIVDLEMAADGIRLQQLLQLWSKPVVEANIYIDFLFIPAYASLIAGLCSWGGLQLNDLKFRSAGIVLAKAVWLAAVLDITENMLMLFSIRQCYTALSLQVTVGVASLKFVLLAIAIIFILVTGIQTFIQRNNSKNGA
ncbi:MAG: hypothetical protein WCH59_11035 [Chitinophagia bacterium]|jgi:hypothetical protein